MAAAERISATLDAADFPGNLSGPTGSVHVEWTYRTTRRKLFLYAALQHYWTSATVGDATQTVAEGGHFSLQRNRFRDIWDGIPTGLRDTQIEAVLLTVDRPKSVTTDWTWVKYPDTNAARRLPTTLTVRLDETKADDGTPRTTFVLDHDGLPVEWIEDMTACWLCRLENGAHFFDAT